MTPEQLLAAYRAALAAGEDPARLAADVKAASNMTPAQLEAHVAALTGGAPEVAPGLRGGRDNAVVLPDTTVTARRPQARRTLWQRWADNRRNVMPLSESLRAMTQGATFGFADELHGAGSAVIPGGRDYAGGRDASRANMGRIREEYPVGALVGEMAGGALIPIGGGLGVGAKVLTATGSRVLAGAAGGAVGGLLGGGLTGIGEADGDGDMGERLAGGAKGAAIGTVAGGLLGGGGSVVGRAAERIRGGLFGSATTRASDMAARNLREGLERAGVPADEVGARLAEMGEGSVVADLGQNLARRARAASNNSDALSAPGGPVQRIVQRGADTRARVARDLRTASGITQTFDEALDAASAAKEEVRRVHYGPLEEMYPVADGPSITAALDDPRIAPVARQVIPPRPKPPAARDAPWPDGRFPLDRAGAPPPAPAVGPSFRELQDVLLELGDEVTSARADGRPGRSRQAQEAYDVLAEAIARDIPEFAPAQAAYRKAIAREEALELGREAAQADPVDIRRTLAGLPEAARAAFRTGMTHRLTSNLGEATSGSGATKFIDAGGAMQDRLSLLADDPSRFDDLMGRLRNREYSWRRTTNILRGNSTTPEQIADGDALLGGFPTSTRDARSQVVNFLLRASGEDRAAAAERIGEALLSEGPKAAQLLAQRIRYNRSLAGGAGGGGGGLLDRVLSQLQQEREAAPPIMPFLSAVPDGGASGGQTGGAGLMLDWAGRGLSRNVEDRRGEELEPPSSELGLYGAAKVGNPPARRGRYRPGRVAQLLSP